MKPEIIPQRILDMSEHMKELRKNGIHFIQLSGRRWGLSKATELAYNTQDAEIVEQKLLTNENQDSRQAAEQAGDPDS